MPDVFKVNHPMQLRAGNGAEVITLDGALTLDHSGTYPQHIKFDCDGATRVITLAPEEVGAWVEMTNISGVSEDLTVENIAEDSIATVEPGEKALFVCSATGWVAFSIKTVALS